MGVSVNSAGSITGAVAMAGTLTIKNANKDSRARIEYVCGKSKSSGTKKKLNYNYKEVSTQACHFAAVCRNGRIRQQGNICSSCTCKTDGRVCAA